MRKTWRKLSVKTRHVIEYDIFIRHTNREGDHFLGELKFCPLFNIFVRKQMVSISFSLFIFFNVRCLSFFVVVVLAVVVIMIDECVI